jgi:uncharacterized protein (TIGR00369 family)
VTAGDVPVTPQERATELNATFSGNLHGLFGMTYDELGPGLARNRLTVRPEFFASNGFLHAATVVALADSACGHGCAASLPEGAEGFTTLELKANYLGTAREGVLVGEATLAHGGRTTQVWDATVRSEGAARPLALFRCTQLILYPTVSP